MTFPAVIPVQHSRFNGMGEDDLGNDTETWEDPVQVMVIGIQSGLVENVTGNRQAGSSIAQTAHTSRVVSDVDMAVPPDLRVTVRDRFTLPFPFNDPDDDNDKPYEVVALEDGFGFHGWRPGYVVKLNRVTG